MLNSLGFSKDPAQTRVAVAMSGGVDSSVVAAMLKQQGYDVIGLTLQLYDHGQAIAKNGTCCAGRDIYDAKQVAQQMGFPHYVLDHETSFKQDVIEDFVQTYLAGATPVPCVRCNQRVKFRDLLQLSKDLGADCLATGHYVRRIMDQHGPQLWAATDQSKDQSYFLFATTKEQLDYLRFPLGDMTNKAQTRELAQHFGLNIAHKPDSQDICFVPNGRYTDVIEKLRPNAAQPGDIIHQDGRILGTHQGIIHYTVGQRKGLTIQDPLNRGEPLFVIKLDADKAHVVVGPRSALACAEIQINDLNWLGDQPLIQNQEVPLLIKVRSSRPAVACTLRLDEKQRLWVKFTQAETGVAPGQAAVLYDPSNPYRVMGGGWIIADQSVYP